MNEATTSVPTEALHVLLRGLIQLKGRGDALASETLADWDRVRGDRVREIAPPAEDTARLDFLESIRTKYGDGVVCRLSSTGRGFRLHETSLKDLLAVGIEEVVSPTVREAIDVAMREIKR